ncbi:transcriptional regulator with XRE-family HTH domain [Virgibacillus halotolerans]|uniref:helix-turn-helix domain-containing protein n=1 Tax=Virgibacillus halotolerans TaxID=1071053 RepID=UPI00196034E8|nr:helix-turn-helix transcriptional regulator [Virgibacillus halotolerans]MBM7601272.1 transcriptional regulator with XRE-family HTH domain [Virgibacillus halotolerans]
MDTKRIGRRIRGFRKLKGYTQVELAKQLDVSMAVIGKIERGVAPASEALLEDIAAQLQIAKAELTLEPDSEQN